MLGVSQSLKVGNRNHVKLGGLVDVLLHLVGWLSDGLRLSLLPEGLLLVLSDPLVILDLELLVQLRFKLTFLPFLLELLPLSFSEVNLVHVDMLLPQQLLQRYVWEQFGGSLPRILSRNLDFRVAEAALWIWVLVLSLVIQDSFNSAF